jgi:hypothetical protein
MLKEPPNPVDRPKFALWLYHRRLSARAVAPDLDVSHEQVRRICLPFGDPDWRRPSDRLKAAVKAYTRGEIDLDDWQEPTTDRVAA